MCWLLVKLGKVFCFYDPCFVCVKCEPIVLCDSWFSALVFLVFWSLLLGVGFPSFDGVG